MFPRMAWYPVAWSSRLGGRRPLAVEHLGQRLAIFRDGGGVARALIDRCPHRAFPLSLGSVRGGQLACAYHGWRFDGAGACRAVPALAGAESDHPARRAIAFATAEAAGLVWAWGEPGSVPPAGPPAIGTRAGPGAISLRWSFTMEGALADVLENILDVPHTSFLHGGLFRRESRGLVLEARVRREADRLEAEYLGEPAPEGLLGRVLAPRGGVVTHVDRFIMPAVTQVEYALGPRLRLLATSVLAPEGERRTRAFHQVSLAPRGLALAILPVFAPAAWWVLRQDARALAAQAANLERHPGAAFASTDADVLGPHIRQMLDRAAQGEPALAAATWSARIAT